MQPPLRDKEKEEVQTLSPQRKRDSRDVGWVDNNS